MPISEPYLYLAPLDETLDAAICNGIKDGAPIGDGANVSFPSALHGRAFRTGNAVAKGFGSITWSGSKNFPAGPNRSFVLRFKPRFNGISSDLALNMFSITGAGMTNNVYSMSFALWDTGVFRMSLTGGNTAGPGAVAVSDVISMVLDRSYDLVVTWDSVWNHAPKIYLDGTEIGIGTVLGVDWTTVLQPHIGNISLGFTTDFVANSFFHYEEFAIYDYILSPTDIANFFTGPTRTQPIASEQKYGLSWPLPRYVYETAPPFYQYGEEIVGTAALPKSSTDPGVGNVVYGTEYMIDDEELTGTLRVLGGFSTLRGFLNYILDQVEQTSLTNDEYQLIVDTGLTNPDYEYNSETYVALLSVILMREGVSTAGARLRYLFLARGADLNPDPETIGSDILIGGEVDDPTPLDDNDDDRSNILLGGSIED